MALSPPPKALLFDVFGTCVDWRSTVTKELYSQAHAALNSATASLASTVRVRATNMTLEEWGAFAQQWRNSYKKFTMSLATDPTIPWKSVDEHHLDALRQLLIDWQLGGLWSDEEQRALSLVWHRLTPWPDSAAGIAHLNRSFGRFHFVIMIQSKSSKRIIANDLCLVTSFSFLRPLTIVIHSYALY